MKTVINTPKPKVLTLTLKKKWFDMVASGEKKEEYRDIKKYWQNRLVISGSHPHVMKKFDLVRFTNGYGNKVPSIVLECIGISMSFGKPEWGGDENNLKFRIRLGRIMAQRP